MAAVRPLANGHSVAARGVLPAGAPPASGEPRAPPPSTTAPVVAEYQRPALQLAQVDVAGGPETGTTGAREEADRARAVNGRRRPPAARQDMPARQELPARQDPHVPSGHDVPPRTSRPRQDMTSRPDLTSPARHLRRAVGQHAGNRPEPVPPAPAEPARPAPAPPRNPPPTPRPPGPGPQVPPVSPVTQVPQSTPEPAAGSGRHPARGQPASRPAPSPAVRAHPGQPAPARHARSGPEPESGPRLGPQCPLQRPAAGGEPGRAVPLPGPETPPPGVSLSEAVQAAHEEGQEFGGSVARDAPALWLEGGAGPQAAPCRRTLEARLLQGSAPADRLSCCTTRSGTRCAADSGTLLERTRR